MQIKKRKTLYGYPKLSNGYTYRVKKGHVWQTEEIGELWNVMTPDQKIKSERIVEKNLNNKIKHFYEV